MEVMCAYCNKAFQIKNYQKKERNYCCKEHYWLFIKDFYTKSHMITCDFCGKKFIYKGGSSHFNRAKKHYCSNKCLCESNRIYPEYHNKNNKRYKIYCDIKRRAKRKGFDFNLEFEDIPEIPKVCPVLGIPIVINVGEHCPSDNSPSVDRIDSTKGYIKGNIRIISNRANRIKADATIDELRRVLEDYEKILNNN